MVSIPHIIFVYKTSALKALKEILFIFLPIKTTSNKVELNQTYSYLIKHFMAIVKVAPESFLDPNMVQALKISPSKTNMAAQYNHMIHIKRGM